MNRARVILLSLLAILVLGLWLSQVPLPSRNSTKSSDIVLFRAVVERLRGGQPYYQAMRGELILRGYPTASVFNWRPPATFILLARAPRLAHAIMLALSIAALLLTMIVFRNAPPFFTITAAVVALGATILPAVPTDGLYMPEAWTGMFLVLSVLCYAVGSVGAGVACAIAAACTRELALPYVFTAAGMAFAAGRWQEVRWYAIGLTVFAAYYLTHVCVATAHMEPGDMLHKGSWIAFGGWKFVIRTVQMGGWFLILPLWTAAAGAVVILASLWSPADRHLKAVVAIYLAAFCIVGQTFNSYWGLMTGPTWGVATVYGFWGLRRLVREA